uniref:Uncharacterized protein n=1 Tax=Cucumis sativus TaxID=3659 RepID=A0A0A0LXH8_CUCSA
MKRFSWIPSWVTGKNGEKGGGDRNLSALAGELRELPYGSIFLNWREDLWEVTTAAANAWIIPYESHCSNLEVLVCQLGFPPKSKSKK